MSRTNLSCQAVTRLRFSKKSSALLVLRKLAAFAMLSCLYGYGQTSNLYENHGVYAINLQNLNVSVSAPVRSKSGAIAFSASNISVFNGATAPNFQILMNFGGSFGINGLIGPSARFVAKSISNGAYCDDGSITWVLGSLGVQTADGIFHPLPPTDQMNFKSYPNGVSCVIEGSTQSSITDNTVDNAFSVVVSESLVTVHSTSGSVVSSSATGLGIWSAFSSFTDSNGNTISTSGNNYIDTLGLTALTPSNGTYSWTDVNGGTAQTVFNTSSTPVRTNFACPFFTDENQSISLLNSVNFADGTSLGLTYEPTPNMSGYVTGRIYDLTLPTGGVVSFRYSGANNGMNCSYLTPPTMTRTTADGTWTYQWASVGTWGSMTTVTDPAGNVTTYTFTNVGAGWAGAGVFPLLVQAVVKQGTSTTLSTKTICYNTNQTNCATVTKVVEPVWQIDEYTQLAGMSSQSRVTTTFDSYGNPTSSARYDFGASSPTIVSNIVYGSWNGSQCVAIGNYINDKPCNVWTTDGTNTLSNALYTYDSHGNRLTSSLWTGASTNKWLSSSTTYNANGTVHVSTPASGAATTFTNGACNGAFPTQTTTGSVTTQETWNCDGGVPLTLTDPNGKVTTFGYKNSLGVADPFWRKSSVTDPLSNVAYTIYGANTLENLFNFGSSVDDTITTVDGLGRKIRSQHRQGPSSSNYDTVSLTYGFSGNYITATSTIPCTRTLGSDCTTGITTVKADPLGRMYTTTDGGTTPGVVTKTYLQNDVYTTLSPLSTGEHVKSTQKEFDGLGRIKSSCSILATGGTSCGQVNTASGTAQTTFAYSTFSGGSQVTATRGSQVRTKQYDALGRLTYQSDPERGAINYYYDVQAACSGSVDGHLTRTVDANGNSICYYYDSLGRPSSVNANGTTCRGFFYDNSTGLTGTKPTGVTTSNSLGRMVEAVTDACNTTPLIDEWFSYDARGQMTDMWESTPHDGGGYFHTTASYFPNGSINTLGGIPGFTTETYSLDGEGRIATAYEGTTAIVSGTTFNPASQPLTISIGVAGGDSDNYAYDPLTGRMTNWTFTVGATPKSQTGTLTWNPNGTLQTLVVGDGFNAGGAHTCNFGYDDLARLTNDNCGSIWAQTFSYDQFNNLTKSGSITWNPGYSSANNRYTLAGTSYDNNGNLLTDTFHTYTWNEFSKLKTIDGTSCGTSGTCLTYDALGRLAEKSVNSTYTEILYSPTGKTAIMSGQTTTAAYLPMPGGSTLYKTADMMRHFWHKDWLGSARLSSTVSSRSVVFDRAFAPYGEMYANFGISNELNFTGDTQDTVAGTFDTDNRELNPNQGRWISPDPAGAGWNLYAYGANPNSQVDPSGLYLINGVDLGRLSSFGIPLNSEIMAAVAQNSVPADNTCPPNSCSSSRDTQEWGKYWEQEYGEGSEWSVYFGPGPDHVRDMIIRGEEAKIQYDIDHYDDGKWTFGDIFSIAGLILSGGANSFLGEATSATAIASQNGTVAEETTMLYRAVSEAEYDDLTANRIFRPGPNSYEEGKFFAESYEDAVKWGKALEGDKFKVIGAEFPKSTADQFMRWERLDSIGPARLATFDQLQTPFTLHFIY